ncbi:MAG: hypothetical protein ABI885_03255 [Gammaproteobacteria bacterium]
MATRFPVRWLALPMLYGACAVAGAPEEFPPDTSKLKTSSLPGFVIAQQKCGICHSADYIELQPPSMTTTQWTAEVVKMQHMYGAPIDEREIAALGEYLGVTYGAQSPVAARAQSSITLPDAKP